MVIALFEVIFGVSIILFFLTRLFKGISVYYDYIILLVGILIVVLNVMNLSYYFNIPLL